MICDRWNRATTKLLGGIILLLIALLATMLHVMTSTRQSIADYYSLHGAPVVIAESAYITQSRGGAVLNIIQYTIPPSAVQDTESGILIYSDSREVRHYLELCLDSPEEAMLPRFVALFPSPQPRVKMVKVMDGTVVNESRIGVSFLYLKPSLP
ncbi:MAG: hypothetical protein H6811_04940 [Phycisphaeraceae bacterium]|nr:hypothetical protein [Phycisphaeraceae bacterium]